MRLTLAGQLNPDQQICGSENHDSERSSSRHNLSRGSRHGRNRRAQRGPIDVSHDASAHDFEQHSHAPVFVKTLDMAKGLGEGS